MTTKNPPMPNPLELAALPIVPWSGPPPSGVVRVPGSKSLTNRALVTAALAPGTSTLTGALDSEDTRVMVEALGKLGFEVHHDPGQSIITIAGRGGTIPARSAELHLKNSGTSLRFLTAMTALGQGVYHLDGVERMRERPIADLLFSLNALGSSAVSDRGDGCPPITVTARGLDGGYTWVKGNVSSQFLSALLMALPQARESTTVEVNGTLVSKPYVSMTLALMSDFGVTIGNRDFRRFDVAPARYHATDYAVEPDASAASYFLGIAAIMGGEITIEGLGTTSVQGDMAFVDVLEYMGATVVREPTRTTVRGGVLKAVDVDMNAISDTVMTLGVVALFAEGVTRIRNVAHIRHKETDRIAALATELRKLGAQVDEQHDGLIINPPPRRKLQGASIATYNDHRMAMSFAMAGLAIPNVVILDPGCVAKTYPGFWSDLEGLREGPRG